MPSWKICPFCEEKIIPYKITSKEIDEDIDTTIIDRSGESERITRNGINEIEVFGCPKCYKLFITDNYQNHNGLLSEET